MINSLVSIARFFLVLQVVAGIVVLVGLVAMQMIIGGGNMWQLVAAAAVGLGLLASAGFVAVLFQISDRLAELIAQGERRPHGQPATPSSARREPTLGPPR